MKNVSPIDTTIDMLEIQFSHGDPAYIPAEKYKDDYTQITLRQLIAEDLHRIGIDRDAQIIGIFYIPAKTSIETEMEIIMPKTPTISIKKSIKSIAGSIRSSIDDISNHIATPIIALALIGICATIILPMIGGVI